jgi:succinate-acetate transporter protein
VIGCLLGLAGVTVAGALLAAADHAHHPVTVASVTVAVVIVLGGPMLMAAIRRNVSRGSRVA